VSAPVIYPERTRYFFQSPSTGHCVFLTYDFTTGRAKMQVWDADNPMAEPGPAIDPHDKGLASALHGPHWDNQLDLERELRARQIDWTADNR